MEMSSVITLMYSLGIETFSSASTVALVLDSCQTFRAMGLRPQNHESLIVAAGIISRPGVSETHGPEGLTAVQNFSIP